METVREKWEKIYVMGEEKYNVDLAWKSVRQIVHTQFTPSQRPYHARFPRSPQAGSYANM